MSQPGPSPLAAGERQFSVEQARAAIADAVTGVPAPPAQRLPLAQALGRVLAEDLVSPLDVPAHDNSAMDGYAFDGAVLRDGEALQLSCIGTLLAGRAAARPVAEGECMRIMTGAVMPAGADTVVPLELCQVDGSRVLIAADTIRRGDNRRRRGEDLAAGSAALLAGRVLRPADLGLAASLGATGLALRQPLRVALFSTGDEIVAPGEPLPPGCIYDSNAASLGAALQRDGCAVLDLGRVRDDPEALRRCLAQALACAEVVVTSGGVSAGDADHTRALLAEFGEVGFWKVAMRPGRPFAFGRLRRTDGSPAWLFALPGNPVAALVTYQVLARDGLYALAGATPPVRPRLHARAAVPIRKRPGRSEYQRATLERGDDGQWLARPYASQGAGVLRSMSQADALLVLPHEAGSVAAGDWVEVWPFTGLD